MADQVSRDWLDKVMHGSVTVGGQVLMGGDVAPEQYEAPVPRLAPEVVENRLAEWRRSPASLDSARKGCVAEGDSRTHRVPT